MNLWTPDNAWLSLYNNFLFLFLLIVYNCFPVYFCVFPKSSISTSTKSLDQMGFNQVGDQIVEPKEGEAFVWDHSFEHEVPRNMFPKRIHGTDIFTYMKGWFNVGINIPVPWMVWECMGYVGEFPKDSHIGLELRDIFLKVSLNSSWTATGVSSFSF